jgi:Rod binding domain-containing protein
MLDSIAGLTPLTSSASQSGDSSKKTEQIKGAAQQFESLMISEMLKSARPDGDSANWLGAGEDDQTGQTAVDYAEQQLASLMSKNGGIGLSKFIVQGLTKQGSGDASAARDSQKL